MPGPKQPDFHISLNEAQYRATNHIIGPILVIAGAGSGKTRTLVYRVARLILEGIPPESILLLTFTRKAAANMLERATEITGPECSNVAGGTFHSFAHRMLRSYAHLAGFSRNFIIMDATDSRDLLRLLAKQMKLSGPGKRFPRKGTLASIISKTENSGRSLEEILERYYRHMPQNFQGIRMVYDAYCKYKKAHGLMDYDDLLLKWRDILIENHDVRKRMGERFQFIMVDEYQDTNPAQAEIIRLMATGHSNVMAVGDDAQSIYSFRGATIRNILDFPALFQGTTIVKLEKNYRTTQPNLDCTNAIIASAEKQFTKHLTAHRSGGTRPVLYQARDENDQGTFVAENIAGLLNKGTRPSEIAVLFRAGFHSFALEAELSSREIKFEKRGGMRLVDSAHIKDLLSIPRLALNPLDRLSLNRALLLIEHLGPKTAEKIVACLLKSDDPHQLLACYKTKAKWKKKVDELGQTILEIKKLFNNGNPAEILHLAEKWYTPYLQLHYADDFPKRIQEIGQLKGLATRYDNVEDLLADLALDPPETASEKEMGGRVVLSTIHSAKGLEWDAVYIISMAEGRFPSPAALNDAEDIEEERRLFYVAATRAKNLLFFCYPSFINMSGAGLMPAGPCRFLQEIPVQFIKSWHEPHESDSTGHNTTDITSETRTVCGAKEKSDNKFRAGLRVRHSTFGRGKVVQMLSKDKVKVVFDVGGIKTLHLKYAKLSIIR